MVFEQIVETMMQMDVFQLFFPWLLVLAVTYGSLDKYDWFEEDTINAAVAVAIAFIAIGGMYLFVPAGLFSHLAAALAFGTFGIIGLMVLLAIAGVDLNELDKDNPIAKLALGGGILAFISILLLYLQLPVSPLEFFQGESFDEVVMPILTLVFLLAVIGIITKGGEGGEEG